MSADWQNIQPHLASDAVVVFDDYTNPAAVEHEGYGVRRLIDELPRSDWDVELLRPIDTWPRDYGRFVTQFAKVTRRSRA